MIVPLTENDIPANSRLKLKPEFKGGCLITEVSNGMVRFFGFQKTFQELMDQKYLIQRPGEQNWELCQKEDVQCARTACRRSLVGQNKYRIWNNPCHFPNYREYCVSCGKKIMEYNSVDELKLDFEIIKKEKQ